MQLENNKKPKARFPFNKIYREEIAPVLKTYEVQRKTMAIKLVCLYSLFCILFIGCFVVLVLSLFPPYTMVFGPLCSIILLFASIFLYIKTTKIHKKFIVDMKRDCLPIVLKHFGEIQWMYDRKIVSDYDLKSSGLFATYNKRLVDDEFQGVYKGVNYKISETHMIYESGSGKNRTVISIFKGVVFSFDLNKTINNRTIVSTKGDLTQKNSYWVFLLMFLGPTLQILLSKDRNLIFLLIIALIFFCIFIYFYIEGKKYEKPLDKVNLEDPMFSKKFDVYSSDQIEARFWITPAFMERFQNLKTSFGAKKAKCSFYDDKLLIAIHTNKNLFEVGEVFKTLENPATIRKFYKELSSINELIDYLKIHEKVL